MRKVLRVGKERRDTVTTPLRIGADEVKKLGVRHWTLIELKRADGDR
jgi:hypothetical protein